MELEWVQYAVAVVTGLATAIPLVIKLVEYIKKSIKEKNWNNLLNLVMELMKDAERKFNDGVTRKEWVLAMVESASKSINYDVDMTAVGKLIDSLCDMTKVVNPPMPEESAEGGC